MIFIGYEPRSKGYQFWDTAHQHFEISCDVKSEETQFLAKELKLTQSVPAPLSDRQIPESDNESDSSGLDLVNLAQVYLHQDPPHGDPKVLDLLAHPLPHLRHWEDLTHLYQTQRLLRYSPLHLNTHSKPQRNKNKDNHKLGLHMETSTKYWYTCSKKFQIPTEKRCLHLTRINGLRHQQKNSRALPKWVSGSR